jgi:aspartyl/asparaginyl-tRNA synthetase
MTYENRRFVIFDTTELIKIDFEQVHETSADTMRFNFNGTKTFVKYDMPQPSSVAQLESKSEELTYDEIIEILQTEEWTQPIQQE